MSEQTAGVQALTLHTITEDNWQTDLRDSIRSASALLNAVNLSADDLGEHERAALEFPIRVPLPFVARMIPGDPHDPLLRQVITDRAETMPAAGFTEDPLEEANANALPGLIHKYKSRVLLMPTSACAVHCRYCFRRHFPYADNRLDETALANIINYIKQNPEINEVILSGGDPLILDDIALDKLMTVLEGVTQLKRLRIHTRLPVVIPARLTDVLAERLQTSSLNTAMVIHCNHPAELDASLIQRLRQWRNRGITLLNQSVLLSGVNDSAETLAQLSERLDDAGVLPYYLHLTDPVAGTAHFHTDDTQAIDIHRSLRAALPGYLVPRLVREIAGETSKRVVS